MARKLSYLMGLAVVGVILYHASGWGFVSMFWWTHRYLPVTSPNFDQMYSATYFALRFVEQLVSFSIPAFLFTSGVFATFATGRDQATLGWKPALTRIRSLAIPFLLWSTVMLAASFVQGETYPAPVAIRMVLLGQTTPAFYFVPLLCQLYLLAPILVPRARSNWKSLLLGAALLQGLVHLVRYLVILRVPLPGLDLLADLTPAWFFPGGAFWFVLGLVAGFHQEDLKALLARARRILFPAAAALLVLGMVEWELLLKLSGQSWISPRATIVDDLYSLSLLLGFLSLDGLRLPLRGALDKLGSRSYGVYLVHSLVLTFLAKAIYHLVPALLAHQWLMQPLLVAAGIGWPLLLMALVRNSPARVVYELQFG